MNNDERKEMERLCALIQTEQDRAKFTALIEELNQLLERKETRLLPTRKQ